MHARDARALDGAQRLLERGVVLRGEPDDHVTRQVELVRERCEPAQICVDGVAAPHRAQDTVVARLERHVQMPADGRGLAQRRRERVVDVVDLDRAQAQAHETRRAAGGAHEPGQVEAGRAIAEAAEVDPRQHDLTVPLRDAAPDLAEDGVGAAAARTAAHERDDAEVARERTAVLDLDERAHAIEASVRLDAADRADVAGDEVGGLLAPPRDHGHVLRQACEGVACEIRRAARDVDAPMCARRPRGRLAALGNCLVGDAAAVDHRDVGASGLSLWPSRSSASRTSCASACETLQPRKSTRNVATR